MSVCGLDFAGGGLDLRWVLQMQTSPNQHGVPGMRASGVMSARWAAEGPEAGEFQTHTYVRLLFGLWLRMSRLGDCM